MKILFLAPQPFYRLRGMCIAQRRILESLGRMGFSVDLLTFPFGEDVEIPGVRILRLSPLPGVRDVPIGPSWRKLALDAFLFLRSARLCLTGSYAVVHACEEAVFIAAALKPFFRFKLLYDMDDVLSLRVARSGFLRFGPALALLGRLEAWAIRSADAVLTNSPDTTRFARALIPEDKVLFYDHMPVVESPDLAPEARQALRDACDLDHQRVILYAGNLEPYQGVDLLIESLPEVFRRSPQTCCVVIGGEPEQIEALRRRAGELGVGSRMRWLGKRPIPETLRTLRLADVLVSPMTQEKAVPMKLYAYMASGVPIVATDIPNHNLVLDARSAVLVPREAPALAEGILKALEDREGARRMGERALEHVLMRRRDNPVEEAVGGVYRLLK